MADNQEEVKSIQRIKKPRTQKQIDATKKMLEGRKQWADNKGKENKAKKVAKLRSKIAKIDGTAECEATHDYPPQTKLPPQITLIPLEDNEQDEPITLEVEEINSTSNDIPLEDDGFSPSVSGNPSPKLGNASKSTPKRKKKVKQVINNYHYQSALSDSEEEEVITNNYYAPPPPSRNPKRRKKKVVAPPVYSSSEEEEEEQYYSVGADDNYGIGKMRFV